MTTPDPALWRAADAIFDSLLDTPEDAREGVLAAMPLAPELRACVQKLLQAHARAAGPLEAAAPGASVIGRVLGDWRIEEEIGRGGMSVVYRASTDEGGERRVAALKLLTLGALVGGGGERFRREQAILARLQHPHIAGLIDSGIAEDGTPWLAMPLVDGLPIDRWCDERGLDLPARITLMLDVCEAVGHAHRNLVIHRDIKPSNVLVDTDGHVRLLDFGIGSLLESRPAGMTLTRMLALTPQYAAPEQFRLAPASTAMDVYGLGALLYRLLVGRPPRLAAAPGDAPGQEPVTLPSRACLEPDSHTSERRLVARQLRGDLDAVLLKALEPDPERRYRSPDALAHDLRAWLEQRPVGARGAGTGYRLRCFLRRHRVGVAATVALAAALGVGLASTLWQADRARAEAARATAVKDFLIDLFESADPELETGRTPDTGTVLARGAGRIPGQFADQPLLAAELLHLVGRIQRHLGEYEQSRTQLLAALEVAGKAPGGDRQRGLTLLQLGALEYEVGQYAPARERLQEALVALEGHEDEEARSGLVYTHMYLGGVASSLDETDAALAHLATAERLDAELPRSDKRRVHLKVYLGQAYLDAQRNEDAWRELQAGLALIPEPGISELPLLTSLGNAASNLGRKLEAEKYYRQVVDTMRAAYPEGSPSLAVPLNNLSLALSARGQLRESEPILRESLALRRQNMGGDSGRLAPALSNYGSLLTQLGRNDEAVPVLEEALAAAASSLGPDHFRTQLVLSFLCTAHAAGGNIPAADACIADAHARMAREAPREQWPVTSATGLRRLALVQMLLDRQPLALEYLATAQEILDRLDIPADDRGRTQLEAYQLMSKGLAGTADPAAAARLEAKLAAIEPGPGFDRADILLALAAQARAAGDVASSDRHLATLLALYEGADLPARMLRQHAQIKAMPAR